MCTSCHSPSLSLSVSWSVCLCVYCSVSVSVSPSVHHILRTLYTHTHTTLLSVPRMVTVRVGVHAKMARAVPVLGAVWRPLSRAGVQPHEVGPSARVGVGFPFPEDQSQHQLCHAGSGGLCSPPEAVLAGRGGRLQWGAGPLPQQSHWWCAGRLRAKNWNEVWRLPSLETLTLGRRGRRGGGGEGGSGQGGGEDGGRRGGGGWRVCEFFFLVTCS